MGNLALNRFGERMPSVIDNFFKPWGEWFDDSSLWGKMLTVPAVNITDDKDGFNVSLAVPGMKKEDFNIDVDGNMITISCEKEENNEEKDATFTRKEYNYSSFKRSFTLPEEVNKEKIDARYEDGVLKLILPKKEEVKKMLTSKHITVK